MVLVDTRDYIECIPNVSLGPDSAKLTQLALSITEVADTRLLHIESNADAHRSVFTFAGPTAAVLASADNFIKKSKELIDMSVHKGVHPRIGAVDVCPFVSIGRGRESDLVQSVKSWAQEISMEHDIPIYLYEKNALNSERKNLAHIRKGNYEGLASKMKKAEGKPDMGGVEFRPKFGAMVTGTRELLVALNISLPQLSLKQSQEIASKIRAISKDSHSLSGVKAIGWEMEEYGTAQVSTNITRLTRTSLYEVIQTVLSLAHTYTQEAEFSTELIGLMPKFYLQQAMDDFGLSDYSTLKQVLDLKTKAIDIPTIEYQLDHPQEVEVLVKKATEV